MTSSCDVMGCNENNLHVYLSTYSPVLEEGLQSLADGVSLLDGEQMLQLLAEGSPMNFNAGRKDLCHPLQGAEGWRSVQHIKKTAVFFLIIILSFTN